MPSLTTHNGFLTLNKKRYSECNKIEKRLFNEHFSDEKLLKMLKKATEPLIRQFDNSKISNLVNLEEIEPHFV